MEICIHKCLKQINVFFPKKLLLSIIIKNNPKRFLRFELNAVQNVCDKTAKGKPRRIPLRIFDCVNDV